MTDPLFIAQVCPYVTTSHGDYRYRIGQPSEALAAIPGVSAVNLCTTSPRLLEVAREADVLVLHLLQEPDLLPVMAERKQLGRPTIYEIPDNFMAVPRHISSLFDFGRALSLSLNFQLIRFADVIQAVSDILLDKYGFLNDRRLRFENHVTEPGPPPRPLREEVVIGWGGSVGHTDDLRWIAPVITEICKEREDVRFSFMGDRGQFEDVFESRGPGERIQYHPSGALEDYFRFLDTLDIGLAPLLESPFNLCRSDVKFIEYASRGVLPVLSDIAPYRMHARHGENALLFQDPPHLKAGLLALLGDHNRLQRIRRNAYQYAAEHRLEALNAPNRLAAYRELAGGRTPGTVPLEPLRPVIRGTRLYETRPSQAEQKTLGGLDLKTGARSDESVSLWEEAARTDPAYAVPCLLLAEALSRTAPDAALDWALESLERNPKSLRGKLLLGDLLRPRHPEGAKQAYEGALDLFADFAPAWRALARLESEQGRSKDAVRLLDRALQGNPFDAGAAFELGKALSALERLESAAKAFDVAAGLIPDNPDYTLELAKARVGSGNPEGAIAACREFLERNPENRMIRSILETVQQHLKPAASAAPGGNARLGESPGLQADSSQRNPHA